MQLLRMFTAICMVLFAGTLARADVFTVVDVPIDAYGASVTEARRAAISAGTEEAANRLVERLTLQSDRYEANWSQIDAALASQLVAGIQIQDEKRSNRRYLGRLQVTFDQTRVRDFLRAQNLPFVEAQTANALILPVWNGAEGAVLWRNNLWRQTWQNSRPEHDLTPLNLPLTDLGDQQALTANQAIRFEHEALATLAKRYDVTKIVVAIATNNGPGRVEVRVGIVSWNDEGRASVRHQRFYGDGNDMGTGLRALKKAYVRARADLVASLEREWKQRAVVRNDTITQVRLTASYTSLSQWRRIRDVLAKSPLVREARLDALSADGALMTLTYVGTEQQLATQLAEGGVLFGDSDIGPVARLR
ncbi:MAG: hypothetical protein COA47_02425 [Robiginitomaculum sp.]|nr:MAG: hypothetical protein COA47_02425 [Robiginitomaculum sp.]